jgi:hypothetical protein
MWWVVVAAGTHISRETAMAAAFRARPVEFLRVTAFLVKLLQRSRALSRWRPGLGGSEGTEGPVIRTGSFGSATTNAAIYEARRRDGRFAGVAF